MAEVTGVRTEYTVQVDMARVYESNSTVDLASLLALAASLAEEGHGVALWQELLAFRDERNAVEVAHRDMGPGTVSVIRYGLAAYRQRRANGEAGGGS